MDPISAAIVAAVVAGATAGLTEVAQKAIGDAYEAIKAKIKEKYGKDSDLADAIAGIEAKPASDGRKAILQEEVKATKADQDQDLLALAKALTDTIQKQTGQSASAIVTGDGVIVQGNNNQVVGAGGVMVGGNVGGDVVTGTKVAQSAEDDAIQVGQARDVKINRR